MKNIFTYFEGQTAIEDAHRLGYRWGVYTDGNEEITIVFDKEGEFVGFEDEKFFDEDYQNWDIGNWEDYDIKGEY